MSPRWGIIQDQHDDVGAWVCQRTGGQWHRGVGTAIGFTFDNRPAAGAIYTGYTGADVQLGFAVEDRRVFNRASIWFAFYYPFQQLGCRRITARVDCDNLRSLALVEHLGFVREATLTHAAPNGDQIQFRMLKSECRWLTDLRYKPTRKAA